VGGSVATYATKYEPLRGYLHSSTLRWSYGAIKGRPADWASQLAGRPLSYLLAAVTAAGFEGVWVDPAGFEPAMARRVGAALRSLLGAPPLLSPDRDLWFFDLRPYRARLERADSPARLAALRARTLEPPRTACPPRAVGPQRGRPGSLVVGLTGPSCPR
jgi:phosphoglycerol transferase